MRFLRENALSCVIFLFWIVAYALSAAAAFTFSPVVDNVGLFAALGALYVISSAAVSFFPYTVALCYALLPYFYRHAQSVEPRLWVVRLKVAPFFLLLPLVVVLQYVMCFL